MTARVGAGGRFRPEFGWLLPAIAILSTCGWLGLIEPTETRYAEIAREMLASGDWLTPHLNGIPHFHKPPVAYWITAAGMAVLGLNEWGARLGVALAAAFVLWCTARIGRVVGGAAAAASGATASHAPNSVEALAPLLLASTALFFALSRQLASDIFLAACVAGFYAAYFDPARRRGFLPFVALGIGFMIKGPVVLVLTVAPVLLAAWWSRDGSAARPLARWRGWLLFAAVALPWYLAVVIQTPGLLGYFLEHQLWERYTTTIHQRGGPVYYFVAVILVGALPWTWLALRQGWRAARAATAPTFENALLLTWIAFPTVFFSFSGSKLPAYVLPLFPALSVLAARALTSRVSGIAARPAPGASLVTAITGISVAVALAISAQPLVSHAREPVANPIAASTAVAALCLGALAAGGLLSVSGWSALRAPRRAKPLTAATLVLLGWFIALWGIRPFDTRLGSPKALAQMLLESRRPGEPVVEYGTFNAGVPFYLREEIPMLEVPRDLGFEDLSAHGRALIGRNGFARIVASHDRVWVVGERGAIQTLANSLGLRATIVAGSGKQTLAIVSRAG